MRENRTQGSVRGRSGNWPSYLDDLERRPKVIKIKSDDLWSELERLSKNSKSIKAAVAYVSDDSCISFGDSDFLVVDASDSSIAGARTSASVFESCLCRRSNYLFMRYIAWEGYCI